MLPWEASAKLRLTVEIKRKLEDAFRAPNFLTDTVPVGPLHTHAERPSSFPGCKGLLSIRKLAVLLRKNRGMSLLLASAEMENL
jgi:hypothetical protein